VKPLRLQLRAFGPYPGELEVDFEHLGRYGSLFLIHGPTGAGKSTVLDGMTYALYGNTRGDQGPERGGREFITTLAGGVARDDEQRTRAELRFSVAGERYRVVRYPQQAVLRKRRRDGVEEGSVDRGPEARLERLDASDRVIEELASGEREVTEQVERRIGANVAQFRQTVVLPQGEFRKVVTDKEERLGVLRTIFDTERFSKLADALNELKLTSARESKGLRSEYERALADAGVERFDDLTPRLARARAASEAAQAGARGLERNRAALQRRVGEGQQLAQRFAHLAELRLEAGRLRGCVTAMQARAEELQRWRRARRAKPALEAERTQREAHAAAVAAVTEAQVEFERLQAEHAAAVARAVARAEAFGSRDALFAQVEGLRALAAEVEGLAELEGRWLVADAAVEEQAAQLAARRTASERLEQRLGELRTEHQGLREEGGTLLERQQLRLRSEARLRDRGRIARLEADLATSRAVFAARQPEAAGFDAARAYAGYSLEGYLERVAPGIAAGSEPAARAAATIRSVHQLELDAAAWRSGLAPTLARIRELDAEHAWLASRPSIAALETELSEAQARFAAAEAASARMAELAEAIASAEGERAGLQQALTTASEELQGSRAHAARLQSDLEGIRKRLPVDARDAHAFRQRLGQLEAQLGAQEALAAEVSRLAESLSAAQGALGAAKVAVLAAATLLAARGAALATALAEADSPSLEALMGDLRADEEIDVEAAAQQDFAQARRANAEALVGLEQELAGRSEPDVGAWTVELEKVEGQLAEANHVRVAAEVEHGALELAAARAREAQQQLLQMQARESAATRLAGLAMGGPRALSFEMFVLRRQFLEVLAAGNTHLQRMTRQRYTFHLIEEAGKREGLDLEIADHHNGAVRRAAKTLSGGEGFLAALALALGLSESAQRAKHPIEALFIDEGFGSLDPATLAQVTQTLRTLPAIAGRMVGIISHVEDLKRLIPVQLVVTPGAEGSTLRVALNRDEG
jgi:DNA repair protein SbcC/Rad50